MTPQDIINYIEQDLECEVRHDARRLLRAVHHTSYVYDLDEWALLRFMLANEPMDGTHSYGFHTSYGRGIRNFFYHWYKAEPIGSIHMN